MALTPNNKFTRNRYSGLKLRLLYKAWQGRKLSLRKLANAAFCSLASHLQLSHSAAAPAVLSLELGSGCNALCLFCRDQYGRIFNTNPSLPLSAPLPRGQMPLALAKAALSQLKNELLIAVLYTNGEPLLYPDLGALVRHASASRIQSMISTNGLLLNEDCSAELLDAGIDFIKIQLSGMTRDIYRIQVRRGDVETIKHNIRQLARKNSAQKRPAYIMIDWIAYSYNNHQLPLIRRFCDEWNLGLNVRPGNPRGGLEQTEAALPHGQTPLPESCEWPYLGMQINFNGDILPCCDAVTWSGFPPLARFVPGENNLKDIWNSRQLGNWRIKLGTQGRTAIPLCSLCPRKGIEFKW